MPPGSARTLWLPDDDVAVDSEPTCVYAAAPLHVNPDSSPLTYRTPTNRSPESDDWHAAEAVEIDRLLVTTTMHAIHLYQQPLDRCGDNTYYNPILKEKYDDDMYKVFYRAGDSDVPTKANIAALSTVKILLQSVVSEISWHWTSKPYTSWHLCRTRNTVQTLYNIT